MYHPLVSVIIPCYNQAEYLSSTLDSVLAQTYRNWEAIIVNDGSPDNTDEIAKRYIDKDSRIKYIYQKNQGLATSRNVGIKNSNGEYILPLDADDLIEPTYLEKAINHFNRFPDTKLVYCKADLFGKINSPWELQTYDYDSFIWENCIFCSAFFKRSDYNKTDGYNPNMIHGYEDWDFWLSLLKKDDKVYRIDEVLFYYRVKEVSMVTELANHLQENLVQLYNNHPEIYDPYKEKLVIFYKEREIIPVLRNELDRIRHSYAYRLGKFLLKPFSWIRKKK